MKKYFSIIMIVILITFSSCKTVEEKLPAVNAIETTALIINPTKHIELFPKIESMSDKDLKQGYINHLVEMFLWEENATILDGVYYNLKNADNTFMFVFAYEYNFQKNNKVNIGFASPGAVQQISIGDDYSYLNYETNLPMEVLDDNIPLVVVSIYDGSKNQIINYYVSINIKIEDDEISKHNLYTVTEIKIGIMDK